MARRLEGRDGNIWRQYAHGATQETLAAQYGISQQRVGQIIREVQATIPEEDLAERRKRAIDSLADLGRMALEIADLDAPQAWSQGRPMVNDDGTPIMDYGTRLAGLDRFLKVADRQAKLLGLDAAQRVDVTVSEEAKAAAASAAADALAFLHGDTGEATPE
jgi:hypothetical protein